MTLAVWDAGRQPLARLLREDCAQYQAVSAGGAASLRFHRTARAALLGRHESAEQALRRRYCREQGIAVGRRLSGGGAWYADAGQLGWTLVARRDRLPGGLAPVLQHVGQALAEGLRLLGAAAEFAPPNDVEIDGRKTASLFAAVEDGAVLVQGWVLRDVDVESMLKVLRVPREKLTPAGYATARRRLRPLSEALGRTPPWEALQGALQSALARVLRLCPVPGCRPRFPAGRPSPTQPPWEPLLPFQATWPTPHGPLHGALALDEGERIRALRISGPVHLRPGTLLEDLAARLHGLRRDEAPAAAARYLRDTEHECLGFGVHDLQRLLHLLAARTAEAAQLGLSAIESRDLMPYDPEGAADALAILARTDAILVPYCAKPTWCKWRSREDCPDCGRCEVGAVYRAGRERGVPVVTVVNYEHLCQVLARLRAQGARAYLGMCCRNFFIKREAAFRAARIPALLLDISGSNCYELRQEELAYAGRFAAQARLNAAVVEKVIRFVPPSPAAPAPAGPGNAAAHRAPGDRSTR